MADVGPEPTCDQPFEDADLNGGPWLCERAPGHVGFHGWDGPLAGRTLREVGPEPTAPTEQEWAAAIHTPSGFKLWSDTWTDIAPLIERVRAAGRSRALAEATEAAEGAIADTTEARWTRDRIVDRLAALAAVTGEVRDGDQPEPVAD